MFPVASAQQREILGLGGRIRAEQAEVWLWVGVLSRISWNPAIETQVALGVQRALCIQVVKVLTLCGNWIALQT